VADAAGTLTEGEVKDGVTMPDRARDRGREPRLSRDLIVRAAVEYVDERGLPSLTMRSLGQRLGVEAMSIYHHVNGREDLLDAMVEQLVAEVRVDPTTTLGPTDGWQAYLQLLARSVHDLATAHPMVFPLVATRHPAASWLRPPLRSLAVVEDFLVAMTSRGLDDDAAVHVYKVFTSFLLGHLLLEVASAGAPTGPVEEPLDEGGSSVTNEGAELDLTDYPTVLRLRPELTRDDAGAQFERALEAVLDRLDLELSQ
jgi:AcrR family transcriptional regulator